LQFKKRNYICTPNRGEHGHTCYSKDGAVAQSVEQRIENPCVAGSIPAHTTARASDKTEAFLFKFPTEGGMFTCYSKDGAVAQSVEQRIENPCVAGSIPAHTTS
jgi:hypothetical protein